MTTYSDGRIANAGTCSVLGACPLNCAWSRRDGWSMSRLAVLPDARWAGIEPLMSSSDGQRGRPFRSHRQVVEGIMYGSGPGSRGAIFRLISGCGRRYGNVMPGSARTGRGTRSTPVWLQKPMPPVMCSGDVSVDSTVNRAHQHATNVPRADRLTGRPRTSPRARTELVAMVSVFVLPVICLTALPPHPRCRRMLMWWHPPLLVMPLCDSTDHRRIRARGCKRA